jgi:class 3 adenylate cyclase
MSDTENYLILFGDLVGSTQVAAEVRPSFYAETYSASYRWAVNRAIDFMECKKIYPKRSFSSRIERPKVAGDEVLSFTRLDSGRRGTALLDTVASAVLFAWLTKMIWLASPYNLRRILGKQFPRDIAVGIHIGPAVYVPTESGEPDIASLHINVTKRIEDEARKGSESRIFASHVVADLLNKWCDQARQPEVPDRPILSFTRFTPREAPELMKGIPKKVQLLELDWPDLQAKEAKYLLSLGQQPTTTARQKGASEIAVAVLGKLFLRSNGNPFAAKNRTNEPLVMAELPGADTASGYISLWFDAVDELDKLFFDECWLVLNCYFMSCALLQHAEAKKSDILRYSTITTRVFDRLTQLMELRKDRGRPMGRCI